MSALTQDWAPGATPGARPFENSPADLELVGVRYAPEQMDLLERGSVHRAATPWWDRIHALSFYALDDPVFPGRPLATNRHLRLLGMPALTVDDDLQPAPVVVPAVVEIDCSNWETMDEQQPNWRRFPSLLGHRHVFSAYTGTLLEAVQPIRLWDMWPLEQSDVRMVQEAVQGWFREEWIPYLRWLEASKQPLYACDFEGTPEHLHDHEYDDQGFVAACHDGARWFKHYRMTEMVEMDDNELYHRPFGPVRGLRHLEDVWNNLLASSQSNTSAALSGYPAWELDDVVRTERHYSAWLWSY